MAQIKTVASNLVLLFMVLVAGNSLALAQAPGDDLKESITSGFLYGLPVGNAGQNAAPGYSLNSTFSPVSWLTLEAGLEQVINPVGNFITQADANRFVNHANDQLYLIPFGPRFFWAPKGGRRRVSIGGGGAYLSHHYGPEAKSYYSNASGFGVQAVASGDYALSPSGRFRLGILSRFYYVRAQQNTTTRVFTIGPVFIFSFR